MSLSLHKSVSLAVQNHTEAELARKASILVPAQVLRAISGVESPDAAGFVDISFRLYENEAHRLVQEAQTPAEVDIWEPELSKLMGVPLDGTLQRYASALFITPSASAMASKPKYTMRTEGEPGTLAYRTFVQNKGVDISPWHDVSLYNDDGTLNFICEIPKDTTAKFEVATGETSNPIKQDVKKGALRHYPYTIPWNYGMLPQTWEDTAEKSALFPSVGGDNDPVDVVEIGGVALETGSVYPVKFLGAYAMLDAGELDWKIMCVRADHPLAGVLHDISDVDREMPGELERILVWFRDYKLPDGKPANQFGFGDSPVGKVFAEAVISDTHMAYQQLRDGRRANISNLSLN